MKRTIEFFLAFTWAALGVELLDYLKHKYGTENLIYLLIFVPIWMTVFVYIYIASSFLRKIKKGFKKNILSTVALVSPPILGLFFLYFLS